MRFRIGTILVAALLCLAPTAGLADLAPYSQDFEGLVQSDPAALTNDGWLVFGNVFTPGGGYIYGYGPFPAPNGGPGFCGIDINQGGPPQGAQQLVVYNDYNNGDHANGNLIEANVFQERIVGAADVGSTWVFEFDAKLGNLLSPTTALAFIKTLDPNSFALTNFVTVDMTSIPVTWDTYSLSLFIDASLPGSIFQFGFASTATNYDSSGIFYDNINFRTAECGNGAIDPGEECDDGNTVPDDGCDENCQSEFYGIPTVSEWGLMIMTLLLLMAGTLVLSSLRWPVAHGSVGTTSMGGPPEWTAPPFDLGLLLRVLAGALGVAALGFAVTFLLMGSVSSVDVVGALLCVPIVSYLVHLFVLRARS